MQLRCRVDLAERIHSARELIERRIGINLAARERRGSDHRNDVAAGRARPLTRRRAVRGQVRLELGLASAQLALDAGRRGDRREIEVLRFDMQAECCVGRPARIELRMAQDRAAERGRLQQRHIELAVEQRELDMDLPELAPIEQRERANGDFTFRVEVFQRSDVDRLVAENVFRLRDRLGRSGRDRGEAEIGDP